MVKRIADAVKADDEKAALQPVYGPFVKDDCPAKTKPLVANHLGLLAATKDGNPHRLYWGQKRILEKRRKKDPSLNVWLPDEDTIYSHIKTFEVKDESGKRVLVKDELWAGVFQALQVLLDVARECFGIKERDFFVTIDSTPNPFYGAGNDAARTPSGLASKPEFRTVDGKSVPWFPGTTWGHDFIVMSIHFYDNLVTLPIAVFDVPNLKYDSGKCVEKLLKHLDQIPESPLFILLDRGFCNIEVTRHLNWYCHKRPGTWFLMPMVKFGGGGKKGKQGKRPGKKESKKAAKQNPDLQPGVKKALNAAFEDAKQSKTYKDGSRDLAAILPRHWAGDKTVQFTVVGYYRTKLANGKGAAELNSISFEMGTDYHCTPFMTNFPVDAGDWAGEKPEDRAKTEKNLTWLETRYTRWICENAVFKAHKAHLGRMPTDYLGARYLSFGLDMIMLAFYGLFRWQIQRTGDESGKPYPLHHPILGLDPFLAGVREVLTLQVD